MKPKKSVKPLTQMNAGELPKATAEFDREFVVDSFRKPTAEQESQYQRAKRKRGRPKIGRGFKVISVSVEQGLLEQTDRLAKKLGVRRTQLIAQGLRAILDRQVDRDR